MKSQRRNEHLKTGIQSLFNIFIYGAAGIVFGWNKAMYAVLTYFIAVIFRFALLRKMIPSYNMHDYLLDVVLRCILLFVFSLLLSYFIKNNFSDNIVNLLITLFASFCATSFIIFVFGLKKNERRTIILKVAKIKNT